MTIFGIEQPGKAIGMLRAGRRQIIVFRLLHCARSPVSHIWQKVRKTGIKVLLAYSFKMHFVRATPISVKY